LRIKEDEQALEEMMEKRPGFERILSLPGMGPILAAVVDSEIDEIGRFESAQKLCGYAGLCPTTSSSGGKTHQGKLMRHCNKWLRWGFVEAAWVAVGCSGYFGDIYKKKRAVGKKANTAIVAVARRMARTTWQLLTEGRDYESSPPAKEKADRKALAAAVAGPSVSPSEGVVPRRKGKVILTTTFPSRSDLKLAGRRE
jgi:hypothetical protein